MITFRAEAREHIETLTANLLELERDPAAGQASRLVEETFRSAHSLKGASRSMGLVPIESVCQAMESVLRGVTRGESQLSPQTVAMLNDAVRTIERLLEGAEAPHADEIIRRLEDVVANPEEQPAMAVVGVAAEPAPRPSEPEAPRTTGRLETLRVGRSKLDDLLLQGEDLLLLKLNAAERSQQARDVMDALDRCRNTALGKFSPSLTAAIIAAEQLMAQLRRDERVTIRSVDRLHQQTRRLRLAPVSSVFSLFPLMVRDLANDQGKEIELAMQGTELEVDLQILETMKDPLIHLVRNAVDHGIEQPDARERAGKPRSGRLELSVASIDGGRVEICVSDDGAGVDPDVVRSAAVRSHVLSAEAAEGLSSEATVDLLFRSGFSTSSVITKISGHGLGLSIVREQVEALGGRIRIESRPGAGASIRILLPTTVATFRGLLVRAGGQPFLVPLDSVQRTIRVDERDIHHAAGREVISWEGGVIPIGRLDTLLDLPRVARDPTSEDGGAPSKARGAAASIALVLRLGEDRAAILVDELLGDREVLTRDLHAPLVRVPCVATAGLLGTSTLVLVLRPSDLMKTIRTRTAASAIAQIEEEAEPPSVLVADDSITTRMLVRGILEAAGYRVQVAVDGTDAWTILKAQAFDLLISDVEMPHMSGFELTSMVRQDPDVRNLPVVLVTALDSREDKERGIAVGANAYVVKSDMEQSNLLEIVRRLV